MRESLALHPVAFADIPGWSQDDSLAAFRVFLESARAHLAAAPILRQAQPVPADLEHIFVHALGAQVPSAEAARAFFETHFQPFRIAAAHSGFLTGYYEPEVRGSLTPDQNFTCPILARPPDLVTLQDAVPGLEGLAAARRCANGTLVPFATRPEIEENFAAYQPLVYLQDKVEVFLIQVQGSARIILPDGQVMRLKYAGRNGHPYTSIGKILIAQGHIAAESMSLAGLKAWLRANGLDQGGLANSILQQNKSYVFFENDTALPQAAGPTGGAGVSLSPLRSIAIDRSIWPYGLPFWLDADLPWKQNASESFARLMIAQDTGSAIIGPARADLYFGSGDSAGLRAGNIRHAADMIVFLPKPANGKPQQA